MANSLKRILRLRELAEEISRTRLQRELRQVAIVESQMSAWDREETESRKRACISLEVADHEGWLVAEAQKELARWRSGQLRPALQAFQLSAQESQRVFLERRVERRQVEKMIESREADAKEDALRREQARLDEWFQFKKGANGQKVQGRDDQSDERVACNQESSDSVPEDTFDDCASKAL